MCSVEEVLPLEKGTTSLTDYKMWCFNGKCNYTFVCNERNANGNSAHVMVYDMNWNDTQNSLYSILTI